MVDSATPQSQLEFLPALEAAMNINWIGFEHYKQGCQVLHGKGMAKVL